MQPKAHTFDIPNQPAISCDLDCYRHRVVVQWKELKTRPLVIKLSCERRYVQLELLEAEESIVDW